MNEKAFKQLINIYSELEAKLIEELVTHFKVNDKFINSDFWRAEKLQELGLLNENIVKYIAKATNKTPAEIRKALSNIGHSAVRMDELNKAYEGGLVRVDPSILMQNKVVDNLINYSYNELTNRFLEVSNKIERATRETYLDMVEKVYVQTVNGVTYQEATRNVLSELGDKGISTLTYKTIDEEGNVKGIRNYDIEGAVRREIVTANHNLVNKVNESVIEELGVEYIKLSEHIQCRPDHFPWQGTIIKRKDLVKVTRYGEVDGLGGPNCKHYFSAYFGEARGNDLKKISKEEATEQYNLSQQQRYLERGVRRWKRKTEIAKASQDQEEYKKAKEKTKEWQNRVKDFTEKNELKRDYTREHINEKKNSTNVSINDKIEIPPILNKISINQNQTFRSGATEFIDKNIVENDIIVDTNNKKPMYYDKKQDKIVINPEHENIGMYQIDESLVHETVHLKDYRNNIVANNYDELLNYERKAEQYVKNNYNFFYNFLNERDTDMATGDIFSALTKGKLTGAFGHGKDYWKDDKMVLHELTANLVSSTIVDNKFVKELLEEIPPLKELKEKSMKLWDV